MFAEKIHVRPYIIFCQKINTVFYCEINADVFVCFIAIAVVKSNKLIKSIIN